MPPNKGSSTEPFSPPKRGRSREGAAKIDPSLAFEKKKKARGKQKAAASKPGMDKDFDAWIQKADFTKPKLEFSVGKGGRVSVKPAVYPDDGRPDNLGVGQSSSSSSSSAAAGGAGSSASPQDSPEDGGYV